MERHIHIKTATKGARPLTAQATPASGLGTKYAPDPQIKARMTSDKSISV